MLDIKFYASSMITFMEKFTNIFAISSPLALTKIKYMLSKYESQLSHAGKMIKMRYSDERQLEFR